MTLKMCVKSKMLESASTEGLLPRLGPWDGPGFICHGKPMIIYNSHATGPSFGHQTKTAAFPNDPQ